MTKDEKIKDDGVERRLDAMIGLILFQLISENKIGTGQAYKSLHDSGLTPTEIGKIVNREAKDIGALITMYEKRKNKETSQSKKDKVSETNV